MRRRRVRRGLEIPSARQGLGTNKAPALKSSMTPEALYLLPCDSHAGLLLLLPLYFLKRSSLSFLPPVPRWSDSLALVIKLGYLFPVLLYLSFAPTVKFYGRYLRRMNPALRTTRTHTHTHVGPGVSFEGLARDNTPLSALD